MAEVNEKCAVFGVYGKNRDVSRLTFFGLFALQHRGQEASGIATNDGESLAMHKGNGLVSHVFTEEVIQKLTGHIAIGHNRYSTSGSKDMRGAQPIFIEDVNIAIAHNGNIPDHTALETFLSQEDVSFEGLNDSQLMAEAIAVHIRNGASLEEAVENAYPLFTGVFSLLVMNQDTLVAVRDSHGIRPLSIGTIDDAFVFASETCAFAPTEAEFLRDVLPGEMVVVDENGMRSTRIEEGTEKIDLFEFIYFARPDSTLGGKSVYEVHKNFGRELARECPLDADIVVPVPETSVPVAIGYAEASGIPYEYALNKNRYIHRTFIQPEQKTREQSVKMKLSPMPGTVEGKHVVLIDDSIVRGTTSQTLITMLRKAGAAKVSFLISSPPVKYPDFYGIDTPKQDKLLAATMSVKEIEKFLGADHLCFLSLEGAVRATGRTEDELCTSCFTGEYPVDIGKKSTGVKKITL